MDRIAQLQQFLDEDPNDPFNKYALALEYQKHDSQKAHDLFKELVLKSPEYVPSYYTFAHLLIDMQKDDEAENIFQQGMRIAAQQSDNKALKELKSAYTNWQFDR